MLQEKDWNILERCFQKKEKYVLLINLSILYVGVVYWENLIGNFEKSHVEIRGSFCMFIGGLLPPFKSYV